jgi:hypothetical protein
MKNSLLCKCQALFATPSNKKNTTSFNGLLALFIMVMGMGVSWGQATLPVSASFSTVTTSGPGTMPTGFSQTGLGGYSGSLKFDTQDDFLQLYFNTSPGNLTFELGVNNSFPGTIPSTATFTIQESIDGISYTSVASYSNVPGGSKTITTLNSNSRYIRWSYTLKPSGTNLSLKNITFSAGAVTYSVTYNANSATSGAVPTDATAYASNVTVTVLGNTGNLVKTGFAFNGWNTAADGSGTNRAVASTFSISSNTTLYAQWLIPTWNGTAWSNTSGPTSSLDAIINGDLTTSTDLICKDLTVNSGTTLTIGAGKKLTVSGNLINNGTIVFKSDATNTAMFDVFNGTPSGTGVVTVERYIPNKRAWRAITAPLKGSNASIFSQWQNNGSSVSNTGVELWGPGGTGSSGNGLAVGPSSSIMQYNAGAWSPITDTKNTNLFTTNGNNAFMIFPTGAYGSGNIASNTTAVSTTLKATGQLITGNVTYSNLSNTNHTLIGNPYASPIDINSILDANATLQKYFWVWDPNGANQGTYNMFDAIANTYTVTNLSYTNSSVIQSGQAFFVKAATGQTGSFTISENNKSTASTTNVFRNNTPAELFRVGLHKQVNNEWSDRDGAMTVTLSDAAANQAPNKMANSTENIAFTKNGASFASNHHLPLVASDVLNVKVWNTTAGSNYKLKLNTEAFTATHLAATLEDLYTNSRTSLNLNGSPVEYPFTVTNDALSTGNRFRIVFQNAVLGNNNPTTNGFSIVPNPVSGDSFQVNLGTLATGTYSYSICNAIGQEVGNGTINSLTQNTNYEVKMSNAATGIYIMKIKGSDNSVYTAKIIKK